MKGIKLYKKAQQLSDKLYDNSIKISKKNKIKIYNDYIYLIRKSAYSGHAEAQFELALHYEEINFFGVNDKYNINKCFYWYQKSCNLNFGEACNNLAILHERKKEYDLASFLYKKAINLGIEKAKKNYKNLKRILAKAGASVPKDPKAAASVPQDHL